MKMICDLSISSARHWPRQAWHPDKLFQNGRAGVWLDPSDMATLFQDAAGTVPITAPGQPVGRVVDKSGNANHATQPINERRPVYRSDGTRHWLEFDGVDDRMRLDAGINLDAGTILMAMTEIKPEVAGGLHARAILSGGVGGYIGISNTAWSDPTSRVLGKNNGGNMRLVDAPAVFQITSESAVGIQVQGDTIHVRRATDPTWYSNSVSGSIGLGNTQNLCSFSLNSSAALSANLFGLILLPDALDDSDFEQALTFMNGRVAP